MKFKIHIGVAFFCVLIVSLCTLQPVQAYTAEEGFAYTADGKLCICFRN